MNVIYLFVCLFTCGEDGRGKEDRMSQFPGYPRWPWKYCDYVMLYSADVFI